MSLNVSPATRAILLRQPVKGKGKGKGKDHPITGHEDPEEE